MAETQAAQGEGISSTTVALPSAREAVKATRFAGGFAVLDRFARRRLLPTVSFGERSRPFGRTAHQKTWRPVATPTRRSHPEGTEA
jgi:hypothetical protein